MSESPTHPDAPRAGGETPPMTEAQVDDLLRAFQDACERAIGDSSETIATKERAILRNELRASLLERHRDGERLDWLQRHPLAIPLQHDASGWRTKEATMLREIGPFRSLREAIDAAQPKETTDAG